MMNQQNGLIMTVSGPIADTQLGFCHSHEHLFIRNGQSAKVNAALRIDSFKDTLEELSLYKQAGGQSIIDAQPVGCGRMAESLYQASVESKINVIASTGFHKTIFYPADHWIHTLDENKLADLFQDELENGMYTDGDMAIPVERISAKPGIIKTASDVEGITPKYRKLFEAAAMAAKRTGTPILSHTEMGKAALEQIRLFFDHGLPADSLIICHLDRTLDNYSYQRQVAETGVYLELDTIGRFKYHSDEAEVQFIAELVEEGFEDQILLGLDVTRERMRSYGGSTGLDYLVNNFIPLLKRAGLGDEVISKFFIRNPARAFRYQKSN
jgi:predicted metal-dependent phosphotriesterase family hydrolase